MVMPSALMIGRPHSVGVLPGSKRSSMVPYLPSTYVGTGQSDHMEASPPNWKRLRPFLILMIVDLNGEVQDDPGIF